VAGHWLLLLDDLLSRRFGQKNLIAGRFRVAILSTIPTVRGPVELDRLGPTLMHEHVFVLGVEAMQNFGHLWGEHYWDEEVRVADAIAKLQRLRDGGIQTIVDPTVHGLGRFVPRLQRINAEVDLNIVVATGVYAFLELPMFLANRSDEWLAELFVREIREGIDDTGVKAGFLKCAVEKDGLLGDVPRVLAAIAAAAVETGAPVMVHTNAPAKTGLIALETLTNAGVDPTRIVIAHAGDSNDLDYLRAIADTGSAATGSTSRTSIRMRTASRRSPRSSPRATRRASISATTAPASTTSCSAIRGSPTSTPTICTSRRTSSPRCWPRE
jgi:predicted metal-dependent phosphotriesterase family hydrolase